MEARRLFTLLAVLAVSTPLLAVGLPECSPGPHCPMAGAMGADAPCGGTAMQEADCCVGASAGEPAELLPAAGVVAAVDDGWTPLWPAVLLPEGLSGSRHDAPSPPLYRLFRSLLI